MRKIKEQSAEYIVNSLSEDDAGQTTIEFRDPIKQLGFAKMEHILTLDPHLSDGAFRVLALLHFFWQRKEQAWVSVEKLAKLLTVDPATISRRLSELQDNGLITRQRRPSNSSITYLEDMPIQYVERAKAILQERNIAKMQDPILQKCNDPPCKNAMEMRTNEREPMKENKVSGEKPSPLTYKQSNPVHILSEEELALRDKNNAEFDALPGVRVSAAEIAQSKSAHRDMLAALSEVCGTDLSLCAASYGTEAKKLLAAKYMPEQVRRLYGLGGEWYVHDWRGKQGQPPNISAINQTILRAVSGAWKSNGNGRGAPHRESYLDVMTRGFALADEMRERRMKEVNSNGNT